MKKTLFILTLITSLMGCKDETTKENPLIGDWSLVIFEPGFSPKETYNKGDVIWKFRQTNTLDIRIDNSIKATPIKKEGVYAFSISGSRISIDKVSYAYSIDDDTLIISDDPSADGFKSTFYREKVK